MSLSTASRASTKWLWQQALIRAGGQDIATQLRERRIGCSSINDWLPASSRFSEIVWQLMAFAPTNVSSYFWFSVWEFVGARPLTVFPHTRSVHFFFLSRTGTRRFTYIPFGHLPVQRKRRKRNVVREPAVGLTDDRQGKEKGNVIRSSVPTAASFSLLLFLFVLAGRDLFCVIRPIKRKRKDEKDNSKTWTASARVITSDCGVPSLWTYKSLAPAASREAVAVRR